MNIDEAVTKTGRSTRFQTLSNFARLDTMVTVADALNVYEVLGSIETLAETNATGMIGITGPSEQKKKEEESKAVAPSFWSSLKAAAWQAPLAAGSIEVVDPKVEEDDRSIVQLMLDQIEFANVII